MTHASGGILLLSLLASVLVGCARERQLDPNDFAGRPAATPSDPASTADADMTAAKAPDAANEADGEAANGATNGDAARDAYTVDAMIGQVNGRPIFANAVLEPLDRQLARLGQTQPRAAFRAQARELISRRIDEIVFNALILGEAERNLTDRERMGLQYRIQLRREELLRRYGQTSPALADERALEQEGKTVEQMLREERQAAIVEHYLQQKLYPKVNVTRRDIERHYREHEDDYNPPPGRRLRVIRAPSGASAEQAAKMLLDGMDFDEVARSEHNTYRADEGGLWPPEASRGDRVFGPEPLNEALLALSPGEVSPRIDYDGAAWWIYLESVSDGQGRSLDEVQDEIRETLVRQQRLVLSERYQRELYAQGSYDPKPRMVDALLAVAMSRYAAP